MAFYAGLDSETYDRQYSNKALLNRIWSYAKTYKKQIYTILIAIFLQGSIGALPPVLISKCSMKVSLVFLTVLFLSALQYGYPCGSFRFCVLLH